MDQMKTSLPPSSILIWIHRSGSNTGNDRRYRGGNSSIGCSATEERQKPSGLGILLFIQEQIFGNPEGTMSTNKGHAHHESRNKNRSDTGKKHHEHGEATQEGQSFKIRESATKNDQRLIRGTEEVEEHPRCEQTHKNDQGERIREERHGKDESNDSIVIDTEVRVVLADAKGGFGKALRFRESCTVNKFAPRTALREPITDGFVDLVDEGAEGRRGHRDLSFTGDGGDGGMGIGDGDDGSGGFCDFNGKERERKIDGKLEDDVSRNLP
ncbi:hypothetical protein G2W53_016652 [Senna tora]|uniref:Uncharacterized protein n=1 Tax=Senna tora TaxID=362788 RepID=A0A834TNE0_9FABA|nr:hypothetical protein G2W53_016652 [Senna tora]